VKAGVTDKGVAVKWWLSLLTILCVPLMAQQSLELPVPPKPAEQVHDQARLFVVEPGRKEALEAKLSEFSERTKFEVQVAFFDNLIGIDLVEQAAALKDEWLGAGPGLVLVVVTDSGEWRLDWASTPQVSTEGGGVVPVIGEYDVAPQEQIGVMHALRELPRMKTGSIEGAELLVDTLLAQLEPSFVTEESKPGHRLRFWVLGIGLVAGIGLLALISVALIRRGDEKRKDQWVFPDVPVGQRLGASAGGGKISVRNFSSIPESGDEASEEA